METVEKVPEVGTSSDLFFKRRMRAEGWDIRDDESVTEFVLRTGGLYHIEYGNCRLDN